MISINKTRHQEDGLSFDSMLGRGERLCKASFGQNALLFLFLEQGNIENIRYGSIEHKGIRIHLFDSTKFVIPKIG